MMLLLGRNFEQQDDQCVLQQTRPDGCDLQQQDTAEVSTAKRKYDQNVGGAG
jgi:hypothetical protein